MERFLSSAQPDHGNDSDFKWYQMFFPKFIRGKKNGKKLLSSFNNP